MEGTASIEIRNLLFATSEQQLRAAVLEPCLGAAGVVSLSYTPRSGKATVEVQSYAAAERAVAELRRVRACSYLGRGLRVELVEANHAGGVRLQDYVENDGARECGHLLTRLHQRLQNRKLRMTTIWKSFSTGFRKDLCGNRCGLRRRIKPAWASF